MSEGSIEHRTNFRPPTPIPGLSSRMDSAMEMLAKRKSWNLIAHGSMVSFTLICIAIVWWSITFRLPLLDEDSKQLRQANQLRNQVEQLQLIENHSAEKKLLQNMQMHEKTLFDNNKTVVDWLQQQIILAKQQGLNLSYVLGGMQRALMTHHSMNIQLHLSLSKSSKRNNYARLIRFVERMHHHGTALHVLQVTMHGDRSGASTMDLSVMIWML